MYLMYLECRYYFLGMCENDFFQSQIRLEQELGKMLRIKMRRRICSSSPVF
jgi:hypothetical protein